MGEGVTNSPSVPFPLPPSPVLVFVVLTIRMKKKTDGSVALACVRGDGSTTWQNNDGARGRFFPFHDLTHYAVETVLGHHSGFYGLVDRGWDLTDFGAPWPRGKLPPEALVSEVIVGFFDAERGSGERWTAAELNAQLTAWYDEHAIPAGPGLTDDDIARVRTRRSELFARWRELAPGDTIELPFDPGAVTAR
jgi:hypothetical protein